MTDSSPRPQANLSHPAYRLAMEDPDFLGKHELRGVRLLLEYEKPERALCDMGILSTIVAFGSARVLSPEQAQAALAAAKTTEEIEQARMRSGQVRWYEMAREFGRIASERGGALNGAGGTGRRNVIATGGGPGLMEAANRGASEAGAPSIGFTIELPFEEEPNPYSSPELTFRFKYFGVRKMHLAMRCSALAVFPGGFGTLDEVFEILNLFSTKVDPIPVIFFDRAYWESVINFQSLIDHGMVSPSATRLFDFADSAEEGWAKLIERGLVPHL